MIEMRINPEVKIAQKPDVLLGDVCTAVKHLDDVLSGVFIFEQHRFADHANFHNYDDSMPDMTVGELVNWISAFACNEGPELARQEPAGAALVKGRARQLHAVIKPLATRIDQVANDPDYHHDQPFLFSILADPRVYWAFDELCTSLKAVAR